MPSVHLYSAAPVDLNALRILGVSVKLGANPIGQFGTGFKYAIATLLRYNHVVTLVTRQVDAPAVTIAFDTAPFSIRGTEFREIVMLWPGRPPLHMGITTDLGKNWKPWMAYRELRSNAMDEAPWEQTLNAERTAAPAGTYATCINVYGQEFYDVVTQSNHTFVDTTPLVAGDYAEIHIQSTPTRPGLFYRGIRVAEADGLPAFTYNVKQFVALTEDRTLMWLPQFQTMVAMQLMECTDTEIIAKALAGKWESHIRLSDNDIKAPRPSKQFLDYVAASKLTTSIPEWARQVYEHHATKLAPDTLTLMPYDRAKLARAVDLCKWMAPEFDTGFQFQIAKTLGPSTYGWVRGQDVYISYAAFSMGEEFLAATILEEFLHRHMCLPDESRAFQDFVLQALAHRAAHLREVAPEQPATQMVADPPATTLVEELNDEIPF